MKLYSENEYYKLYQGSMLDMLEVIDKESIDSIITDPPYELNFMNKGWDNSGIAFQKETWKKCYEVLKPGGYLLAFGGSRTFHRIACAIEDAGFEIRDTIMWLYGSGFPKSMDISKSLDKRNGRVNNDFIEFGKYLKEKRGNVSQTEIRKLFPSKNGTPTGNASNWELGKNVPTLEQYKLLKEKLNLDNRFDWLIEREEAERKVIGKGKRGQLKDDMFFTKNIDKAKETGKAIGYGEWDITIPSTDLAKQWQGWGTALKPSFEPIIVARKPFKDSLVDNVIEWGVGGINIDECRVETQDDLYRKPCENGSIYSQQEKQYTTGTMSDSYKLGRFPANTILTYDETDFDEVCGGFPNTKDYGGETKTTPKNDIRFNASKEVRITRYKESGSASRYFYCAKASKKDRDEGLEGFEEKKTGSMIANIGGNMQLGGASLKGEPKEIQPKKNTHPTVKPTELMQYLIRLVSPEGSTILDCFNGSGSTGKAVMYENKERDKNYKYIGIELTEEYLPIAKARIEYVCNLEPEVDNQTNIFDFIGE